LKSVRAACVSLAIRSPMPILTSKQIWKRADAKTRKRRIDAGHLEGEQEANVIRAIVFLGKRHGGLNQLSRDLGAARTTVTRAVHRLRRISPALALRVARIAGVALSDVLSGAFPGPGECPMCGGTGGHKLSGL
jgi:hypothetical protein